MQDKLHRAWWVPTLEALAILIADPPLNRRRERIASAVQAEQAKSPNPRTIRAYLEDILERLPQEDADE